MKNFPKNVLLIVCGAVVGFVNGFFGGGGGMIAVPLMEGVLKEKTKTSHATAILIILPISIMSAVIYIIGGGVGVADTLSVSGGTIAGGVAGALILNKLNNRVIRLVFAVIMVGIGIKMAFFR